MHSVVCCPALPRRAAAAGRDRETKSNLCSVRGSGWVLDREIKNEQEVLGQFLRALRHRKPSGRGCARAPHPPSPAFPPPLHYSRPPMTWFAGAQPMMLRAASARVCTHSSDPISQRTKLDTSSSALDAAV